MKIGDVIKKYRRELGLTQEEMANLGLDLAVHEKDVEATERIIRCLIDNSDSITAFVGSPLYSHMKLKPSESTFMSKLRSDLIESFKDEDTYGYMHGNDYWETLKSE